jgi:dTDP-glucose 4,6-dehydratase
LRRLSSILVTGGCGFIGCNFIRLLLEKTPEFQGRIINLDVLTYAGNPESLTDIEKKYGEENDSRNREGTSPSANQRYYFEHGDICDKEFVGRLFEKYQIDTVVHFAAESHVDRSILGPEAFIKTNVFGTFTLLEAARGYWRLSGKTSLEGPSESTASNAIRADVLFHHVSTDEVYGSLGETGFFTETTPYDPRSPYSAAKASSDHLVMAYYHTYGLPVTLSNCSNNYGPYQFPEKLIPLSILNMLEGKPLPVYGDGKNIRDWVFVEDHNNAIWTILKSGKAGEKYNIGGENEQENIALLHTLINITAKKTGGDAEKLRSDITFVKDRPGHDRRYAIDCSKIKKNLGWKREVIFEEGLEKTVDWYLENKSWIDSIRSGEYRNWIEKNYGAR